MIATLTRLEALDDQALLTFEDEQALGALLTSDNAALALRARDVLVRQNLRLVWHVVNTTVRKRAHPGLTRDDLFQTGCEGLLYATTKWDYTRRLRFSTYALLWIEQRIRREIDTACRLIRLPVWIEEQARLVKRTRADLAVAHGVAPSWEAVQAATGLTQGQLALVRHGQAINDQWSLEATQIPGSDGLCLKDAVADPLDLEEAVADTDERREAHQTLAELLAPLPPRHRQVVILRYGLAGHEVHTLDQVGTVLGITRERARQLQAVAMTRIRQNLARKGEV
jgi:RNA polymerase sigma factor (sigma-70 family)